MNKKTFDKIMIALNAILVVVLIVELFTKLQSRKEK